MNRKGYKGGAWKPEPFDENRYKKAVEKFQNEQLIKHTIVRDFEKSFEENFPLFLFEGLEERLEEDKIILRKFAKMIRERITYWRSNN